MDKKYHSLFGADSNITPAQYLAELICKKSADSQKITLPKKFWSDRDKWIVWAKKYQVEIIAANKLLKLYKPLAIINALKSNKAYKVQSLYNKWLTNIITEEQRKIDQLSEVETCLKINTNIKSTPTKKIGKKNKLSGLKD